MARELQQVINANGITEATRKEDNGGYEFSTKDFEILGESIRLKSQYYSLNYVVRYFVDANNDKNLVIVFEL